VVDTLQLATCSGKPDNRALGMGDGGSSVYPLGKRLDGEYCAPG
jgi:hypothetical protein